MWNEFFPTRKMRASIRMHLPPKAFLLIDRGEALFVSNAPIFSPDRPAIPGFSIYRSGRNICFLPDDSWILRLERRTAEPPDELSRTLMRFRGEKIENDALKLYAQALKISEGDTKAKAREIEAFETAIRKKAAIALRSGGGGGLYGLAVALAQLKTMIHTPKDAEQ